MTDINKLRQVFINVLGNAVKFTEQGSICLRARVDRGDAAGPSLRVEIEDTGPGISPDDQDKLFRHFEQTKSGQQAGTGTGLGLAISQEFVRLMGGAITVSSQVDQGSVFVIQLPLKEGEADAVRAKEKPRQVLKLQPGQPACRVLIADDLEDNRQLLAQLLAPVGFDVRLVTNGAEAVAGVRGVAAVPDPDGLPHAGDGRPRGDPPDPRDGRRQRTQGDRRDGQCPGREPPGAARDRRRRFHQQAVQGSGAVPEDPRASGGGIRLRRRLRGRAAEQAAAELTPESLAALPQALIDPMREAVITADLDLLLAKIDDVEARDPRLAAGLRRLAEAFQYQELLDLFSAGAAIEAGAA